MQLAAPVRNKSKVKRVIVNHFTMKRYLTDEQGRLYDPDQRQFFKGVPHVRAAGMEALAAFNIAAKLIHNRMERWSEGHGLSEGRLRVLGVLRFNQGCMTMTALAEALRTTPRNVTGLIDHLEKDGYVERVSDPADRRSVLARLTEKGEEKIGSVWKMGLSHQAELTKGFTQEELAQLRHLCLRLAEQLNDAGRSE
jgi:DNA-binding MarR family transcriptional regulator